MASLPTEADVRKVQPVSVPGTSIDTAAFTSGGRALQQGGAELFSIAAAMEDEAATNEAKMAAVELSKRHRILRFGNPDSDDENERVGYEGLQGQSAVDARGRVQEQLRQAYDDIMGRISRRAAGKFQATGLGAVSKATEAYEIKSLKARQDAYLEASAAVIEEATDTLVDDPFNDTLDKIGVIEKEVRKSVIKLHGDPNNASTPEERASRQRVINEKVEEMRTKAIVKAIERIAQTDPIAAESFYKAKSIFDKLDPKARNGIEQYLEANVLDDRARSNVDAILAKNVSYEAGLAAMRSIKNTKEMDESVRRYKVRYKERQAARNAASVSARQQAINYVTMGGDPHDLIKDEKWLKALSKHPGIWDTLRALQDDILEGKTHASRDDPEIERILNGAAELGPRQLATLNMDDVKTRLTGDTWREWDAKVTAAKMQAQALEAGGLPAEAIKLVDQVLADKYPDAMADAVEQEHMRTKLQVFSSEVIAREKRPPTYDEIQKKAASVRWDRVRQPTASLPPKTFDLIDKVLTTKYPDVKDPEQKRKLREQLRVFSLKHQAQNKGLQPSRSQMETRAAQAQWTLAGDPDNTLPGGFPDEGEGKIEPRTFGKGPNIGDYNLLHPKQREAAYVPIEQIDASKRAEIIAVSEGALTKFGVPRERWPKLTDELIGKIAVADYFNDTNRILRLLGLGGAKK